MHGYGKVTRVYSGLRPRKEMCRGCRDDFYNDNNGLGVTECWSFGSAEVCDKVGHRSIHSVKPDETKIKTLTCWHAVSK